ncbi:flagellar biosynthesis protein [Sphingobium aquiterrae]|uniref:FliH/SctL family protein n=1 Tax=Sphingobium aquiterrae TaxID=2038656 RepID=UPI00301B248A
MSRLLNPADAQHVTAIALGGFRAAANQRSSFRALYADGQEVHAQRPAEPEPEAPFDPLEQARVEAFTMGFEEGCRITAQSHGEDHDTRQRLAAALEQLSPADPGTLSTMLSAAVIRLVGQIVGEVAIDTELLRERCEAVAACVDESDGKNALHLHPDDIPLLEGATLAVPVVADLQMRRGSVRLDTADGWIEDGPDVRLSRLHALLDNMEGRA